MIEFAAYLAAQHVTRSAAHEALPDSPMRSDDRVMRRSFRSLALRQQVSMALRRLADLVEPAPEPAQAAVAGCR